MSITLVVLAVVVGAIIWWVNKSTADSKVGTAVKKVADINRDGRINVKDAVALVVKVADANADGKVNLADAVVVGKKAVEVGKTIGTKVRAVTKKKKNS
jgi:hypothetical protein